MSKENCYKLKTLKNVKNKKVKERMMSDISEATTRKEKQQLLME